MLTLARADHEYTRLLNTLEENRNIIVLENAEEWEDDEKPPQPTAGEKLRVPGSIVSIAERLDDELTRSLQHVDPHTAEYIERLSDEQALYTNIIRGLLYTEDLKKDTALEVPQENINRLVMRRLEHIYFKVRSVIPIYRILVNLSPPACTSRYHPRRECVETHSCQVGLGDNSSKHIFGHGCSSANIEHLSFQEQPRHHPSESLSLPSLLLCSSRPILQSS